MKDIAVVIVLIVKTLIESILIPPTGASRRRLIRLIRRKYPSYKLVSLEMKRTDWSSSVREADDGHKATSAKAVISRGEEQRTLCFSLSFLIWKITHDAPDFGKNVPEDEYYMEDTVGAFGKRINVEESIRGMWVIPDEAGRLYHKSGSGENWYYSCHYIREFYRTQGGRVCILNKETFVWEPTDKPYSELDHYCNYTRVSRERAEQLISSYRQSRTEK